MVDRTVFSEAADLIDNEGWCQDNNAMINTSSGPRMADVKIEADRPKCRCVFGAVLAILDTRGVDIDHVAAIGDYDHIMDRSVQPEFASIVNWNDAEDRTKQEVVNHLKYLAQG